MEDDTMKDNCQWLLALRTFTTFLLPLCLLMFCTTTTHSQTSWTKYAGNPIMQPGQPGSWDDAEIYPGPVLFRDSVYHLWYIGQDGTDAWRYYRSGYARSTNGINWTKHPSPVVDVGVPGSWDSYDAEAGAVLYDGDRFKMWYNGYSTSAFNNQVGYATGMNETTWTKRANPVLSVSPDGSWDDAAVMWTAILRSSLPGGFRMWYAGWDGSKLADGTPSNYQIGYATATNETTWTKHPLNPVLMLGSPGQWDDARIHLPMVVADSAAGRYYMFYTGMNKATEVQRIGLATSSDGIAWTKYSGNPLLGPGPSGSWDGRSLVLGGVIMVRDTFRLWYTGLDASGTTRIGYATSPRNLHSVLRVPSQYSTIQAAINAAVYGDTVLVSDGTYYENIRFKGKKIVVASTYITTGDTLHISNTIIDGSHATNPDSGSVVYFVNGEDTTSVLCGFTITGGTGTKIAKWTSLEGGGVLCYESGARLTKNIITGNVLYDNLDRYGLFGAGVSADGTGGEVLLMEGNLVTANSGTSTAHSASGGGVGGLSINIILRQNVITYNVLLTQTTTLWAAGGGVYTEQGSLFADGNLIARNKALCPAAIGGYLGSGGGVFCEAVTLDFRNNRVIGNVAQSSASIRAVGGGLVIYADNPSEHRNCSITGNYFSLNQALGGSAASGGGIDLFNEGAVVQNNIIVRNKASVGGGIGIHGIVNANPVLINNTLAFNSTFGGGSGGGISCDGNGWNPIVLNTIVWGDTGAQEIGLLNGSQVRVQYSDISGGYTGTGNLNADPRFVISDSLYNLQSASPCIGRGIDSLQIGGVWYRAPAWDFAGRPRHRPLGPQSIDMGAQEEQITVDVESQELAPVSFMLDQNFPNPFNPSTTIRYGLPHKTTVQMTVFNTLGQQVAVLQNGEQEAGYHEVRFDGTGLSSGVYFYRLRAGDFVETRKLLLLR
jgi:predicted GH43/DUF377 family glycosyl hydrolase